MLAWSRCRRPALLLHRATSRLYSTTSPPPIPSTRRSQAQDKKQPAKPDVPEPTDRWNYNTSALLPSSAEDIAKYPTVTANELEQATAPPTGVKMLVRDFIEDSLYNPHYGYFPKQATIFNSDATPVDFASLRDSVEFQEVVAQKYADYGSDSFEGPGRQIWHTPTELFKVSGKIYVRLILTMGVALLRPSYSTMFGVRVLAKVLPIRRLRHIRDWRRKRNLGPGRSELHPRELPHGLRENTLQHH